MWEVQFLSTGLFCGGTAPLKDEQAIIDDLLDLKTMGENVVAVDVLGVSESMSSTTLRSRLCSRVT